MDSFNQSIYLLDTSGNDAINTSVKVIYDTVYNSTIYSDVGKQTIKNLYDKFNEATSVSNEEDKMKILTELTGYIKKTYSVIELSRTPVTGAEIEEDISLVEAMPTMPVMEVIESYQKTKQFALFSSISKCIKTKFMSIFSSMKRANLEDNLTELPSAEADFTTYIEAQTANIYQPTTWANDNLNIFYTHNLSLCATQYTNQLTEELKDINDTISIFKITKQEEVNKEINATNKEIKVQGQDVDKNRFLVTRLKKLKDYLIFIPEARTSGRDTKSSSRGSQDDSEIDTKLSDKYINLQEKQIEISKQIENITNKNKLMETTIKDLIIEVNNLGKVYIPTQKSITSVRSFIKGLANKMGREQSSAQTKISFFNCSIS